MEPVIIGIIKLFLFDNELGEMETVNMGELKRGLKGAERKIIKNPQLLCYH